MPSYQLPAPPAPAAERALVRARRFLTATWRGRAFLVALGVVILDGLGLNLGALAGLATAVLWIYAQLANRTAPTRP